jgi:hypothetical protein
MAPEDWISGKQFDKITESVRDTVMRVDRLTPSRKRQFDGVVALHGAAPPR